MRTLKVITTAAALVAAGALAGCATTTAVQEPGGPGSPVLVSDGEAIYQKMIKDLYGTAEDRVIAEKLQHHRIQTAIADCMKAKGFTYTIPVYEGIAGGPIVPGDIDGAAPLAADFAIAATRQRHAEAVAANAAISNGPADPAQQANYDQALTGCADAGKQYQDTHFPSGTNENGGILVNNLLFITDDLRYESLAEDYRDCLADAGYPVASWAALHQDVLDKFPPSQPGDTMTDTPQWATAVAYEKAAAAADRDCRVGLHEYTMSNLEPRIERIYQEANGGGIREVTTNWDTLLAEAKAAGIN